MAGLHCLFGLSRFGYFLWHSQLPKVFADVDKFQSYFLVRVNVRGLLDEALLVASIEHVGLVLSPQLSLVELLLHDVEKLECFRANRVELDEKGGDKQANDKSEGQKVGVQLTADEQPDHRGNGGYEHVSG